MSLLLWFTPLVVMMAVFYFMLILPNKKIQKKREELWSGLTVGDKIITVSWLHGDILEINEKTLLIKSATSDIKIEKQSVISKTNN